MASAAAFGLATMLGAPAQAADQVAAAKALIEKAKSGLVAPKDPTKPELELTT